MKQPPQGHPPQAQPLAPATQPPVPQPPAGMAATPADVAVVSSLTEIVKTITEGRLSEVKEEQKTERERIAADKEMRLAESKSHGHILLGLLLLAVVSGAAAFYVGRPDLGTTIVSSTLTGILGFLAGRATAKEGAE